MKDIKNENMGTTIRQEKNARIDDIEWLRAAAIIGVLISHSLGLFTWKPQFLVTLFSYFNPSVGVDLFFVISGFVIARSLLPKLEGYSHDLYGLSREIGAFWLTRAFRLLPSAWLWLGVLVLAAWLFNSSDVFGSVYGNLFAGLISIVQLMNFFTSFVVSQYGYLGSLIYWSLSLEEQFYLVLPILAILLRKRLVWLLVIILSAQALVPRDGLLLWVRTDALAWGVLLALFSQKSVYWHIEPRNINHRWILRFFIIVLLLAGPIVITTDNLDYGRRYSIVALLSVVLVWLASYNKNYLSGHFGIFKTIMLWIGGRSYAIYLIHGPAIGFVHEAWFRVFGRSPSGGVVQAIVLCVIAFLLIALLSEINYRLVEMPLRAVGKNLARRLRRVTSHASVQPVGVCTDIS